MSDIALLSLLVAGVLMGAGFISLGVIRHRRRYRFKEGFLPISGWRPTGHIDFVNIEMAGRT